MIISRTPFRVSLFGGGTDYPAWFKQHGGAVLGLAIDKYCYVSIRRLPPFFEHRSRIVYSRVETVTDNTLIEHPAVRGVLAHLGISEGVEIHHDADLPARSGLGSSSAFVVGLLNAARTLFKMPEHPVVGTDLAAEATYVEQVVLDEAVGCQDQKWAWDGGMNQITFHPDGRTTTTPLVCNKRKFASRLFLVWTGLSRLSTVPAAAVIANFANRQEHLHKIRRQVNTARLLLFEDRFDEVGDLLHASWMLKRDLADGVSSPEIDAIYDHAIASGARGGKLCGAGAGGMLLFYVAPEQQGRFLAEMDLAGRIVIPVGLDTEGSTIVLNQPEGL